MPRSFSVLVFGALIDFVFPSLNVSLVYDEGYITFDSTQRTQSQI